MANAFRAAVVTPEASVFEQSVQSVQLPAFDGQLGILSQHAPLLTRLGSGLLQLRTDAGEERFFISGGYAQMKDNMLTILTEQAMPANTITVELVATEQAKVDAMGEHDAQSAVRRKAALERLFAMRRMIQS